MGDGGAIRFLWGAPSFPAWPRPGGTKDSGRCWRAWARASPSCSLRRVRSALDLPGSPRRFVETTFFPYADAIAGRRCAVLVERRGTCHGIDQRLCLIGVADIRGLKRHAFGQAAGRAAATDRNLRTRTGQRRSDLPPKSPRAAGDDGHLP